MLLERVAGRFTYVDDKGYSFSIKTVNIPEFGWGARLELTTGGLNNEIVAVQRLKDAAEQFLRMLNDTYPME